MMASDEEVARKGRAIIAEWSGGGSMAEREREILGSMLAGLTEAVFGHDDPALPPRHEPEAVAAFRLATMAKALEAAFNLGVASRISEYLKEDNQTE